MRGHVREGGGAPKVCFVNPSPVSLPWAARLLLLPPYAIINPLIPPMSFHGNRPFINHERICNLDAEEALGEFYKYRPGGRGGAACAPPGAVLPDRWSSGRRGETVPLAGKSDAKRPPPPQRNAPHRSRNAGIWIRLPQSTVAGLAPCRRIERIRIRAGGSEVRCRAGDRGPGRNPGAGTGVSRCRRRPLKAGHRLLKVDFLPGSQAARWPVCRVLSEPRSVLRLH